MKYSVMKEANNYNKELSPTKKSIFMNGGSSYSNSKAIVLKKEFSIPVIDSQKSGVIIPINTIWYTRKNDLIFYNYNMNKTEKIYNFSSKIEHVIVFNPISGIFESRIEHCLLVITEFAAFIYAIDGENVVNTDFTCNLSSRVMCVNANNGRIYVGCMDGETYQIRYNQIDMINYKYMNLSKPFMLMKRIQSLFKKKKEEIIDLSVSGDYMVTLSAYEIVVYNIQNGGMFEENNIRVSEGYMKIQIVENSPLLFYCVLSNGKRDFYDNKKIFCREFPMGDVMTEGDVDNGKISSNVMICSDETRMVHAQVGKGPSLIVINLNTDQLKNFSRLKPVENYERVCVRTRINAIGMHEESLVVLGDNKVSLYEILDCKRFLKICRPEEIWAMYKRYGDMEFMAWYYEMLAGNEDITRLEGICRSEMIRKQALFVFIDKLVQPIFSVDLYKLLSGEIENISVQKAEAVIARLKKLKNKIPLHYEEAVEFIDEFVQTYNYAVLLHNYSVAFSESFESILMTENDFKNTTSKMLLETLEAAQSVDPLVNMMKNNCPRYLISNQVNLQRGIELLEKGNGAYLENSLECFNNTQFNEDIIDKYNSIGFFYGSVVLIREKFSFSYEDAIVLLRKSVKCKKAVEAGMGSSNEAFLYPFFEVLLDLKEFDDCKCCDGTEFNLDLIKIEHPVFLAFLKDKGATKEAAYNLHWRYLVFRNRKVEAVEALISVCSQSDIDFTEKIVLMETALTICTSIDSKTYDKKIEFMRKIKLMLKLAKIQMEMEARDPSIKTNQLLSADVLFNDYCIDHPDLGIKVLDAIGYCKPDVLNKMYKLYFEDKSLSQALVFLSEIKNKELATVFNILLEKSENCNDFCNKLHQIGFSEDEIIKNVNESFKTAFHPKIVNNLLKSLELFVGMEKTRKIKKYCETILS